MDGWVKLHRQVLDRGWLSNPYLWAFWCYCLLKASHKATEVMVGYQRVKLKAGQFVYGRNKAAQELKMSEQRIRTIISHLRTMGNLTIKSTNRYSIITIVNWNTYQLDDEPINQQVNQHLTSKQPATNHIQEGKEGKEQKKESKTKAQAPFVPPPWIPLDAWEGYREMRAKIRKPMTPRAATLAVATLEKLRGEGHEPEAVLNQSILNSWQGLFALRDGGGGSGRIPQQPKSFDQLREEHNERVIRAFADRLERMEHGPADVSGGDAEAQRHFPPAPYGAGAGNVLRSPLVVVK